MIQKPPIHSLDSANGPSVTIGSAPVLSTVVETSIGSRPPPNTQMPASLIFSLTLSTASKIGCISSMVELGRVVDGAVHGEHVLGHLGLLHRSRGGPGGFPHPLHERPYPDTTPLLEVLAPFAHG